jgi:RNA polymerase sigma-70 factor (sigma-E family)
MTDRPSADEAGFRQWVALREKPIRRRAFLLSGSWHAADDLVQEVMIAVYAVWPRLTRVQNIDAYANRILVNKYVDDQRRPWRRERPVETLPDAIDRGADRDFEIVEGLDSPLIRAMRGLPATQRVVLVLRFAEDLTVDEIAHVLELPSGTVKSRLSRACEAIRVILGADELGEGSHAVHPEPVAPRRPTSPFTSITRPVPEAQS